MSVTETFDPKSLDYTKSTLQDQLLCPICCYILTDPISTVCGHTFCKDCIQNALKTPRSEDQSFKCPIDRHPLTSKTDLVPAAFLITSLLNELDVLCPFSDRGCKYEGKKWNISDHVDNLCDYVKVECECGELIQRRYFDKNECVHEQVDCTNNCGEKVEKYLLNEHLKNNCINVKTDCPYCKITTSNPELEQHLDICPEMVISCSAAGFGCLWTDKRSNFEKHCNKCHFVQLSPLLNKQEQRMDSLERENRTLRYHIERLTNRSSLLAFENLDQTAATSSNNDSNSQFSDSDLLHMFMECERLRRDVDRLGTTLNELEVKQGMMIMRENCRTGDEIANLKSGFNGLRQQLHFLLAERRSMNYSRIASTSVSAPSTSTNSDPRQNLSDLIRDVKL